jgi:hypothetical protein
MGQHDATSMSLVEVASSRAVLPNR